MLRTARKDTSQPLRTHSAAKSGFKFLHVGKTALNREGLQYTEAEPVLNRGTSIIVVAMTGFWTSVLN